MGQRWVRGGSEVGQRWNSVQASFQLIHVKNWAAEAHRPLLFQLRQSVLSMGVHDIIVIDDVTNLLREDQVWAEALRLAVSGGLGRRQLQSVHLSAAPIDGPVVAVEGPSASGIGMHETHPTVGCVLRCSGSVMEDRMHAPRCEAKVVAEECLWSQLVGAAEEAHELRTLACVAVELLPLENPLPRELVHIVVDRDDGVHRILLDALTLPLAQQRVEEHLRRRVDPLTILGVRYG